MAIKYDLTAIEIIKLLGYTEPISKQDLEQFEEQNNLKLPTLLFEFLSLARNNPLFSTADIWAMDDHLPYFSYEVIEEEIEECQEDFDDPELREENAFYPFSLIPKEKWPESVANYLQIGSDYGAGVVYFGIEEKDLTQENPPVYMQHEEDDLTEWKLFFPALSDYLMTVLFDVLACVEYRTAKDVLEKEGWNIHESTYSNRSELEAELSRKNIDLSAMTKVPSLYGSDAGYRCCFDEEEKALYLTKEDDSLFFIKAE